MSPHSQATETAEAIRKQNRAYSIFPWSIQSKINPIAIAGGRGARFWDADGVEYLDFASQLVSVNAGHQHPRIVAAIKAQADKLCTVSPTAATDVRGQLAELVAEVTPGRLTKTFFTLGGSDANDTAIKIARLYTGRQKIITRYKAYHGATFGAQTLSGDTRRLPFEPGIPSIIHAFDPYCYRCTFGQRPESCDYECVKHIEEIIGYEGPEYIAAVMIEAITGSNGIHVPPPGYMPRLRAICDKYNLLLIDDEVMAGWGRTGKWFGIDHWNVEPDMMTTAKGLTSGYVPMGAVVVSDKIANFLEDRMFSSGFTYGSNPLACAAGIAAINVYKDEKLVENSHEMGLILADGLASLKAKHPAVGDVRSIGLWAAIDLLKDPTTKAPLTTDDATFGAVVKELLANRLYSFARGTNIVLGPPLCINKAEVLEGLEIIDRALLVADQAIA